MTHQTAGASSIPLNQGPCLGADSTPLTTSVAVDVQDPSVLLLGVHHEALDGGELGAAAADGAGQQRWPGEYAVPDLEVGAQQLRRRQPGRACWAAQAQ